MVSFNTRRRSEPGEACLGSLWLRILFAALLPALFCVAKPTFAQQVDYRIDHHGPRTVYAGHNLHIQFWPTFLAGAPATWMVTSVEFANQPALYEAVCGSVDCYQDDSSGNYFVWGGSGSIVLRVAIPPSLATGTYPLIVRGEVGGVTRSATIPITVWSAPTPPVTPNLGTPPPIPTLSKWESIYGSLARKWCPATSNEFAFSVESQVWYYDGARTYYQLADYTGDRSWETCALRIAEGYRGYVLAANGGVPGWRIFGRGLRLAYERTGDVRYRQALALMAQNAAFASHGGHLSDEFIRETAYSLQAYVEAERAGEPRSPMMGRAVDHLLGHFDRLFITGNPVIHQTFYDGIAAEALIDYYELTKDPRVPPMIKIMLDWVWNNLYNPATGQLRYAPGQGYITELNNMVTPAYAWYYSVTGDVLYQQRGDEMFSHALDTDITYSGKIFNQNFRWSYAYVRYRQGQPSQNPPAAICSYSPSPNVITLGAPGGAVALSPGSVPASCSWSVMTNASWIGLSSGGSGKGNTSVALSVDSTGKQINRSSTVYIGGVPVYVRQRSSQATVNVSILSTTPGVAFKIDNDPATYVTPRTFVWYPGASYTIRWEASQTTALGQVVSFGGWSDGNTGNPRTLVTPNQDASFTANFNVSAIIGGSQGPVIGATFNPIRVNAGSTSYTDPEGNVWSTDTSFSGGQIFTTRDAISGTNAGPIYQFQRFSYSPFTYTFQVPSGNYNLKLKWAELSIEKTGERLFHVDVNGTRVLTSFDVYGSAGGPRTAVDRVIPVAAANGSITVTFIPVQSSAIINAIELTTSTTTTPTNPPPTTPSTGITPGSTTFTPVRVNTGGQAITDSLGRVWSADAGSNGGLIYTNANPVSGTTEPLLFRDQRFSYSPLTYSYSVPNGAYQVKLMFAELSTETNGQRLFHVDINGNRVLTNFDVHATAGGKLKAVERTFAVNVADGAIRIVLTAVQSSAIINAIEIVQGSASSFTPIRINTGSNVPYTDPQGQVWASDQWFDTGFTYTTNDLIANTDAVPLLQIQRFANWPLNYRISVPNGNYQVRLLFAELSREQTGERQFHVDVNGNRVLTNFDIFSEAGGARRAVERRFAVTVVNGQIQLTFTAVRSSAVINAIEITGL
jgi:hypothetical protein